MCDRIANGKVSFHLHPTVAACGRRGHGAHTATRPDGVDFMHADRICSTNDRRNVMRFVDLLHADGQIGLTTRGLLADTGVALFLRTTSFGFGGLVSRQD